MNKQYKIVELLDLQAGQTERGEWKSQEVVLEACDNVQYPDRYLVRFTGEKVEMLNGMQVGDIVEAQWSAWVKDFTTRDGRQMRSQALSGWKIEKVTF